VIIAITQINHGCAEKNVDVAFSLKQIAKYIDTNQKSPAKPSNIRPSREYCFVMRANWPSALSNEFAHTKSSMPNKFMYKSSK
jgi:hypothetical protein